MPRAADGQVGRDESFGALFAQSDPARFTGQTLPPEAESLPDAPEQEQQNQANSTDAAVEPDRPAEFEVAPKITLQTEGVVHGDRSGDHPGDARADLGAAMVGSRSSYTPSPSEVRTTDRALSPGEPVVEDFAHRAAPNENTGNKQMAGTGSLLRREVAKNPDTQRITSGDATALPRVGDKVSAPELPRNTSAGALLNQTAAQPASEAPIRATPETTHSYPSRFTRSDPESAPAESVRAAVVATTPVAAARTPAAPMAESVLRTRISERPFSTPGAPEGQGARSLDGAVSGFGLVLGEQATASSNFEVTGSRMLRAADFATADAAREIAQQIGARITPLARGQFEMMLAPVELGRLEVALREVDGVMTLSVSAERPETLELIRRHIDLLAQELRQIAQRELALHVGTDSAGGRSGDPRSIHNASDTALTSSDEAETPRTVSPVIAHDHLDLRL
jgi:flagellar hook-length control protein FliK